MTTPGRHISGSDSRILHPGNLPLIRSEAWHSIPPFGSQVSVTVPTGRAFALPLWTGRRCLLTAIAVNVTVAIVGGNIRMGLYTSANAIPSQLIADFGTVGTGVLGPQQIAGLRQPITPYLYFLVICRQGGVLNLGLTSRDSWEPIVSETVPTLLGNLNSYYIDGVAGALPAVFGVPDGAIQGPAASLQLV